MLPNENLGVLELRVALPPGRHAYRLVVDGRWTADPFNRQIEDNPFAKDGEHNRVHTIFLAEPLDRAAFEAFAKAYDGPERLAPGTREFYVDFVEGVARSMLDPAMKKARIVKGRATARNLRSLQRMLDKMG